MTGYTSKNKGYYKCAVKGCKTNVSAQEMHHQYADILDNYVLSPVLIPIFKKVLGKKFQEKETINVEAQKNLNKNLENLKTKIKKVKSRYALGEIEKDVYDEINGDLLMDIDKVEKELAIAETKISY